MAYDNKKSVDKDSKATTAAQDDVNKQRDDATGEAQDSANKHPDAFTQAADRGPAQQREEDLEAAKKLPRDEDGKIKPNKIAEMSDEELAKLKKSDHPITEHWKG